MVALYMILRKSLYVPLEKRERRFLLLLFLCGWKHFMRTKIHFYSISTKRNVIKILRLNNFNKIITLTLYYMYQTPNFISQSLNLSFSFARCLLFLRVVHSLLFSHRLSLSLSLTVRFLARPNLHAGLLEKL